MRLSRFGSARLALLLLLAAWPLAAAATLSPFDVARYVKVRGKAPVRLVLYPGEGHGNRLAAHRVDYNLRMIQWMEHYLKGPGGAPPPYEIEYEEKKK